MAIVKRAYDTRVREIIARTGNADLFPELDIPRGTRATWVRRGRRDIVGLDEELDAQAALLDRLAKLEHRVRMLTALLRSYDFVPGGYFMLHLHLLALPY